MLQQVLKTLRLEIPGRGLHDITDDVRRVLTESGLRRGLITLFLRHTSASLLIQENADATVRADFERFFSRLVPDGDPMFAHDDEGPDDMPARVRTALTQTSLGIPFDGSKMVLGTWQGIYVYEHRTRPHTRELVVHALGDR